MQEGTLFKINYIVIIGCRSSSINGGSYCTVYDTLLLLDHISEKKERVRVTVTVLVPIWRGSIPRMTSGVENKIRPRNQVIRPKMISESNKE